MFDTEVNNPGYPNSWSHLEYKFKEDIVYTQNIEENRQDILNEIIDRKNSIFVEIGIYGGATLLSLYDICKINNNKIFGIDPHDKISIYNGVSKEETSDVAKENAIKIFSYNKNNLINIIKKYSLEDVIHYINENSKDAIEYFKDNSIDVLHIDGDHSFEGVYQDLFLYYPKIKNDGVIILDDCDWTGVNKAINNFCEDYKIKNIEFKGRKAIIRKVYDN